MSLKFIYGRAGSGKTSACFSYMSNLLEQTDSGIIYLVPEPASLESERRIIDAFGGGATGRIDVLSFERLAQRVFTQTGPVGANYIDNTGRLMLMQSILLNYSNKLNILSSGSCDMALALVQTVRELKHNGTTPEMLLNAAQQIQNVSLKLKLCDIALIYDKYCQALDGVCFDADDDLSRLAEQIEKHDLFKNTYVIIDGFSGFMANQLALIGTLMVRCPEVLVSLTTDHLEQGDMADVFYPTSSTATQLLEAAYELGVKVLPSVYTGGCTRYDRLPDMAYLEENYFNYRAPQYSKVPQNISIYMADNYYGEVDAAASYILQLCRTTGCRFRDIAVVTNATDTYLPYIKNIFSDYEINFSSTENVTALQSPLSGAILGLFDILIHNFAFEPLFSWFRTPFSGLDQEDVFLMENYIVAAGNSPSRWLKDDDWEYIPHGFDKAMLERVNKIKNRARTPILSFKNRFSGRKTVAQIIEALCAFFEEIGLEERIESMPDELIDAYNGFISVLEQMYQFMGNDNITFEKFASVLHTGLNGCEIGRIPQSVDEVEFCSVVRFKNPGIKHLLVLGVTDGVLPQCHKAEGVFSDADRLMLKECGAALSESAAKRQAGENFALYQIMTATKQSIRFSYPVANHEGKALEPSSVITRLKAIFPNIPIKDNVYLHDNILENLEGRTPSFNRMLASYNDPKWAPVSKWFKKNYPERYNHAMQALSYTNQPKKLSAQAVTALYGSVPGASISKAEQYNRCAYAYFLKYGLNAAPRPSCELDAPQAGTIMHEVIELFCKWANETGWKQLSKEESYEQIDLLTMQVLTQQLGEQFSTSSRMLYLARKTKRILRTAIWNIAEFYKQSPFIPLGYELSFEDGGDYPPIEIELNNGNRIRLVGKVDRADIYKTEHGCFVNIVDYKSSAKDINFTEVLCGIQIQLPTYIKAICGALNKDSKVHAIPAAMLYYKIDAPYISAAGDADNEDIQDQIRSALKMKGLVLEDDLVSKGLGTLYAVKPSASQRQIEKLCSVAERKLKDAFEEILDGEIQINPLWYSNKKACDYCPYSSVCRFDPAEKDNRYRVRRKITGEEFFEYASKMDR